MCSMDVVLRYWLVATKRDDLFFNVFALMFVDEWSLRFSVLMENGRLLHLDFCNFIN
jgi:hypothetical protein